MTNTCILDLLSRNGAMARRRRTKHYASGKGTLIKGMSGRLPSDLFDSPMFKERLEELMRRYAGIYALYRRNTLYYVGLTKNLWGRVRGHLRDRHKNKWDRFIIFLIKRVKHLKDIETLLQQVAEPPGNRVRGKVPRDSDLNRLLRDELRSHEKAIRKLRRAFR